MDGPLLRVEVEALVIGEMVDDIWGVVVWGIL